MPFRKEFVSKSRGPHDEPPFLCFLHGAYVYNKPSNHKETYPHLPVDITGFWSFFLLQKIITSPRWNLNLILKHDAKNL